MTRLTIFGGQCQGWRGNKLEPTHGVHGPKALSRIDQQEEVPITHAYVDGASAVLHMISPKRRLCLRVCVARKKNEDRYS
jgi:hypothetical protein